MFRSIRWRIALPYLVLILLVMAGLGTYISGFVRQSQLDHIEDELTSEARLLSHVVDPRQLQHRNADVLGPSAANWSAILNARVTLVAGDGSVLADSAGDPTQLDNHLQRPEIQEAVRTGIGKSTRFSQTTQENMMYVAVSVLDGEQVAGFVRLALSLEQTEANIDHLIRTILLATIITTFLAIILALLIAEFTTRPIRLLTSAAGQMEETDFGGDLTATAYDEIEQLSRAYSAMRSNLNDQITTLQAERTKLSAVLQQMTDGLLIVGPAGEVQLVNSAAERMFGIDQQAALDQSLATVLRHHQIVEMWKNCRDSRQPQISTIDFAGRNLYLQVVAIPLGSALLGSILLLFQDLTNLRRLETIRRDFISNISHELRTPLASLKALLETLQEGALDDPPAARRFLLRIESELDALTQMVQELLELSRIESGRVPLQLRAVNPQELLAAAFDRMRLQAERAELGMDLEVPSDLPPVLADPARVEQVIVNLINNAIKFTPSGGDITLSARQRDDMILISVQDTGVGIPARDLPRIFERFYKADRARSGGGTGLGLAIARHIVEAHGGSIWVESVEGRGSTFTFNLPVAI